MFNYTLLRLKALHRRRPVSVDSACSNSGLRTSRSAAGESAIKPFFGRSTPHRIGAL